MFRCGWRCFRALAALAALAVACSSGATHGAGGAGGAGGEEPNPGRSGADAGGVGAQNSGGFAGSHSANGGSSPGGSDTGGAGGADPMIDCDDDDPCTVDAYDLDEGCQYTPACSAGVCEVASCDPETGQCSTVAAPDGLVCDDGRVCTGQDRCSAGTCQGALGVLLGDHVEALGIPDGTGKCNGNQPLTVDFQMQPGGAVTAVEVMIEVDHPNLSDLTARLLHVPSGREALLFDDGAAVGTRLSGQYVFAADGADLGAAAPPNTDLAPSRYVAEDLATVFGGDDVEGTWRLFITDRCRGNAGEYTRSRLVLFRDCSVAEDE